MTRTGAVATTLFVLIALDAVADKPKFTSTWNAPEASSVSFVGRKVAALVMSSDQNLRISGEEQLVRDLDARGAQGVASYRLIPQEELTDGDRAKPWFERAGVEGVVALRPVKAEVERTYAPSVWTTTSYSTLWGYYGYGWTSVYSPGGMREDSLLVVEALVYSVPMNKLLWGGVSTTTNPKSAQAFIKELVGEAVKEMKKKNIVK